ncbi:hypothetical protein LINGRAHAP2_LOCUS8133, partial [Linum grandiflorum]
MKFSLNQRSNGNCTEFELKALSRTREVKGQDG